MTALTTDMALLAMWIIFTAVSVAGLIAVLVWAVRTRQFSNQDHARHLPLESGVPEDSRQKATGNGQQEKNTTT